MAKPDKKIVIAAVFVGAAAVAGWLALRPHGARGAQAFTGYVVSDDVYMSAPIAGTLTAVSVKRGDRVAAGQALFRVDPTVRAAQADQARAAIAGAEAQVAQQQAALMRARADLAAAQAQADSSGADLRRLTAAQAEKAGAVAAMQIDQARAAAKAANDRRDAAAATIASAAAAVDAARAQVAQNQAGLTSAQRELDDLAPAAPTAGRVEEVMYRLGESVAANAPVVTIVPDGEVKVRFYVPQSAVAAYRPGRQVAIACDGCASGLTARVDFVARRPEFTPPVIYSLDARQKLVFMVEAVPSDPRALTPGQPMDVAGSADELQRR